MRFLFTSFLSGAAAALGGCSPERKLVERNLMMHDGKEPSAQGRGLEERRLRRKGRELEEGEKKGVREQLGVGES